jgi:hypothetical protein
MLEFEDEVEHEVTAVELLLVVILDEKDEQVEYLESKFSKAEGENGYIINIHEKYFSSLSYSRRP